MSLLMDALKKAELAKRQGQGQAAGSAGGQEVQAGLTLEPMGGSSPPEPAPAANLSPQALASRLEELDTQFLAEIAKEAASTRLKSQPASAVPVMALEPPVEPLAGAGKPRRPQAERAAAPDKSAAQNVFAAKQADKPSGRKAFAIAIGTITVLSICAIGGYFWWQLQPKTSLVASRAAPAPAAMPAPAAAPPAAVPPAPTIAVAPATTPAAPVAGVSGSPLPAVPAIPEATNKVGDGVAPIAANPPAPALRARPAPAAESDTGSPVRVSKAPLKVNPALLRGFDAFNRGDMEAAQLEYERAQTSDPRNTDALHGLAAIAVRQGRHDQADLLYRRIAEADPQDTTAMSALINNRAQIDPGIAESRLKSLSASQPDLAAPQFALGNVYARQGRWNEAQQAYFRAYGAEQDNPDILYNLAISLEHLRQNKLAAQYYSLAIAAAQSQPAGFDRAQATARLQALQR